MSLRNFLVALAALSFVVSPAARGGEEKPAIPQADPAAELLAKAVPDASSLPTADMAVVPSLRVLEDAIVITVNTDGYVLAYLKPQKLTIAELIESKELSSAASADELAKDLNQLLDRPLWDGLSGRDRERLSKRHVFLVVRVGTSWQRAVEALHGVTRGLAKFVWFVAKDANGGVGALAAWLPTDQGDTDQGDTEVERASFDVMLDRNRDATAIATAEQLYGAAHAMRSRAGVAPMDCVIRPASASEPIESVLCVVNECRRFGFRARFANSGQPERKDIDPDIQTYFHISPSVEVAADLPAKVPGRAVSGDPQKND